jgi:hypothetical protein
MRNGYSILVGKPERKRKLIGGIPLEYPPYSSDLAA